MKLFSRPAATNELIIDTFAAAPVDMTTAADSAFARDVVTVGKRMNTRGWSWYKKIGEIHYAVGRSARTAGYAELGVYERRADGTPGKKITSGEEAKVASRLMSYTGGMRGLIERFVIHMKVPGTTWLIRVRIDGEVVGYDFVSDGEWDQASLDSLDDKANTQPLLRNTMPPGSTNGRPVKQQTIERRDLIGRVWRQDAQWADLPDSPMYALDDTCEVLHLLTKGLKVKLNQRLLMNGVWYFPSEIADVRIGAPTGKPGELHNNKIIDNVLKQAQHTALSPEDPMSPMPIIVSGPGDQAHNVVFAAPDREIFDVEMKLRTELIDRILFGLDINPQGVKGTTEANHWGAWAASDDEQRINIKPDLETLCWALTVLVMNRELSEANVASGRIAKRMVWYDLSAAVAKTNLAEDGRQAFDRGGVGPPGMRRMSGIDESDAPTEVEVIRMVGWKMGLPELALHGIEAAKDIDFEKIKATKSGPNPDSNAPDTPVGPGKGDPGSTNPADRKNNSPKRAQPG